MSPRRLVTTTVCSTQLSCAMKWKQRFFRPHDIWGNANRDSIVIYDSVMYLYVNLNVIMREEFQPIVQDIRIPWQCWNRPETCCTVTRHFLVVFVPRAWPIHARTVDVRLWFRKDKLIVYKRDIDALILDESCGDVFRSHFFIWSHPTRR